MTFRRTHCNKHRNIKLLARDDRETSSMLIRGSTSRLLVVDINAFSVKPRLAMNSPVLSPPRPRYNQEPCRPVLVPINFLTPLTSGSGNYPSFFRERAGLPPNPRGALTNTRGHPCPPEPLPPLRCRAKECRGKCTRCNPSCGRYSV